MAKDRWFVIPSALMTDAEKRWFKAMVGGNLDDLAEAGVRIADDGIYFKDRQKAHDIFEEIVAITQGSYGPPPGGPDMRIPPAIDSGKFMDRAMESIGGPPKPSPKDLLGFQLDPSTPLDELSDDALFSMDDPPVKGSPGAQGDDPEVRKTRTEWNKQLLEEGKLKRIGKNDLAQIDGMIQMRRTLGMNLGSGADEAMDFIQQSMEVLKRVWTENPEEFLTEGPDGISQADMDAWLEKMQKHGEYEYKHLSPESQQVRAHWGFGQPGDVRRFPVEERRLQVENDRKQDRINKLGKEAQEAQAKYQEEFRKAITEMKKPGLRAATLKGVFKKLGVLSAKLGGAGTAIDILWPSQLGGDDPYSSHGSMTGVPKGWTGPEWRERQERDVEGADWLAQQPGYGDTPPWTNVPSRPRDPEAYEMLAPGQQKQEDRLSAAEEAVRMDQLRKKPIELLER